MALNIQLLHYNANLAKLNKYITMINMQSIHGKLLFQQLKYASHKRYFKSYHNCKYKTNLTGPFPRERLLESSLSVAYSRPSSCVSSQFSYYTTSAKCVNTISNLSGLAANMPHSLLTSHQQCRHYTNRNILKLHERGVWADRFPSTGAEFEEGIASTCHTMYAGFDPTADSLHIGHLLVLVALLHCQRAGHNIIALIGGFTAQVGDPTGRHTGREQLADVAVAANVKGIQENINRVIGNHATLFWDDKQGKEQLPRITMVNNYEWLPSMTNAELVGVLRCMCGLGVLLSRSFVKKRLEAEDGIKLHEFMYQVYQAYDWLHLYDKYKCTIQIGGSDQMGNIMTGQKLIKRYRQGSVTGLTVPLITDEAGDKLGKTSGSPVWLNPVKTSQHDFYQFFLRTADTEVERLLKLLTFVPLAEIEAVMVKHKTAPEARGPQLLLAKKVTLLVHGEYGLSIALRSTEVLYGQSSSALVSMNLEELSGLFPDHVVRLPLQPGQTVMEAAIAAGCFRSSRDGERIIRAGGFSINQHKVKDPHVAILPDAHILPARCTLFRVGKHNYCLVVWQ